MNKDSAYKEITDNGGEPYARFFAAQNPEHPLTPFCHRYLSEKDLEALTAAHDEARGIALKSPGADGVVVASRASGSERLARCGHRRAYVRAERAALGILDGP